MDVTRRTFLASTTAMAAAGIGRAKSGLAGPAQKGNLPSASAMFKAEDYASLRKALRAFYPNECHGACKDPAQLASVKEIGDGLDAWVAAHPGYDALDVRRESYLLMQKHFHPVIFPELPFYFEAGTNGGWCMAATSTPSRHVNRLCRRFYSERGLIPYSAFELMWARNRERLTLCCGPFSDDMHQIPPFHTIFTKGFGGVRAEVASALAACPKDDPHGRKELETALVGLDTIHVLQLKFKEAAEQLLAGAAPSPIVGPGVAAAPSPSQRVERNLTRIIAAAARCPWEPPRTFFEGLNTLWFIREITGYADGVCNFALGRPDAWLIDLYRADLAAGRLTVEEARDLVACFLLVADCHHDGDIPVDSYSDHEAEIPLTLGGCDTEGRPVWNELTELFLDAHIGVDVVFPKLHCRISASSPAPYLRKIADMLMKGHAVFALFNDDITIPNFLAMGYPLDRARDYVCCGCWDGNVDSLTDVDAANYMSVARVLELTLHRDPKVESATRITIDPIDGATSFEQVRDTVYRNFIRFFRNVLSEYTRYGRANAQIFPHPVYSMCLEGGLKTRRDTTEGGVAFRPRVVTLAFLANVVDSLCAIRRVCFEEKSHTLAELLAAVRSNWSGAQGEAVRQAVLKAPYWGDDTDASNDLMRWWIDSVANDIAGYANDQGGPYVLACWIYREFMYWGAKMKATPDGRHDGDRLAQGFSPSEFRCQSGATTVLNAIGAIDHSRLYASNANLAFEKSAMSTETFEAVFRVACRKRMHLLQPNCISVEELLDAQTHPERHRNLIIKVCGFSARFVALSKRWQDEVIARHRLR